MNLAFRVDMGKQHGNLADRIVLFCQTLNISYLRWAKMVDRDQPLTRDIIQGYWSSLKVNYSGIKDLSTFYYSLKKMSGHRGEKLLLQ